MARFEHIACGYSEYAPGCDEWGCLVHRIDFAARKGWTSDALQARLDASLANAIDELLTSPSMPVDDQVSRVAKP